MADNIMMVENLTVSFKKKDNKKPDKNQYVAAVDQVSLSVGRREIFGIVGESGCGKTTLSRSIVGLIPNSKGRILLDGTDIIDNKNRKKNNYTDKIQMIFQNPLASFNPRYTIRKSIYEVGNAHGISNENVKKKLENLLQHTGLADALLDHYPNQLSGGQLQRFAICRALILDPEVLIADEAVSALDISLQAHILNLLLHLRDKLEITIVFVSHDLNVVEHICDSVAVMYLGRIVEIGDKVDLFHNTKHPYTKLLIHSKTKEDPEDIRELEYVFEDVPNIFEASKGCRFSTRCPDFVAGVCDEDPPELKKVSQNHYAACHFIMEEPSDHGIYRENI